jgi:hypothetical protein
MLQFGTYVGKIKKTLKSWKQVSIQRKYMVISYIHFVNSKERETDQLRYSQIIGSLMYLAGATRPDISYAVSKLSRFTSNLHQT